MITEYKLRIMYIGEEYKNEPLIKVKITEGKYAGQVKKYHKNTAKLIIENGSGVAL